MNIEKLSNRLEKVVSYIPTGSRIADIGSDHAYLPCYAISKGVASYAIAGEVVKGPYLSAEKQVEESDLTHAIDVRMGDGLQVIAPGEVDCITIAGMGGALIASILEKGKVKLDGVTRLILQPNIGARAIRVWLFENGWELQSEEIIEEESKIYEILVAEKGNSERPYSKDHKDKQILMGPFLLLEKNEAFIKKWKQELEQWNKILRNMEKAEESKELIERRKDILTKIRLVKEELDVENN